MNEQPSESYPDEIRSLRGRLGLTQVALAGALGVSYPTVNRWENGKSKPSPLCWSRLLELAEASAGAIEEPEPPPWSGEAPPLDFTARAEVVRTLAEGERLSFGHLANPAFATEIANIEPLPHQRIAVYDQMLGQPRLRFLLADDAGAGKTIMTGLYIREMLSRRLLDRVLIVPPAGLIGNWKRELATLFSLHFEIATGAEARTGNPFIGARSDRLIVSVDTLAGGRVFDRLQERNVEPYDLVVFDEAHKLACDRGADYRVRKTDRYRLAEALAGAQPVEPRWRLAWHAHHLLLLTATPHMGKDYPFYALWRLLEPEALATPEAFEAFPGEQRRRYFIRRTKEEMVKFSGEPLYPKRIADTLTFELSQGEVSEQSLYDRTTEYLRHAYDRGRLLNQSAARLALGVFQRRLASSTHALACSLERRLAKLSRAIEEIEAGRVSFEELLARQRKLDEELDVFETKTADEERFEAGREENEQAEDEILGGLIASSLADLVAERHEVAQLRDLARRVEAAGLDSKLEKLREVLTAPRFAHEKLIVFTEHRDTLEFLVRRLSGMGYTDLVGTIHGGMDHAQRQQQVERFRRPADAGGVRFLICTDAAAEGINLQFCWLMINYDVPWNPARLEQRMGRIHRYGQKHDPVVILNLVAPRTREGKVLKTLLDKLETIRKRLRSDKVYDSIGRVFAGVSIRRYMELAVLGDAEEVARELDGKLTAEQVKAIAERERRLFGGGGDVERELPRLRDSVEQEAFFRLLPGYVRSFLTAAVPLVGLEVEGDLGGTFALRGARAGAIDPLLPTLETYPAAQRSRLSVQRPEDPDAAIWLHPGEPVFERFRELVRTHLGEDALRGAVFVDPTASQPYLFYVARLRVVRLADPEFPELWESETIECRLVGLRQQEGAEIAACPVEQLLLLRGGYGLPTEAQRLAVAATAFREQAQAFLVERVARAVAVARREALLASLAARQSFVQRGFDFQEVELARMRAALSPKARQGDAGAARRLEEVKEQQRSLAARRGKALSILRREPELIVPGEVAFIAHALVVPSFDPADRERHEADVERIAMDLVRAFEESAGAAVTSVHTPELARAGGLPDHPGFDLLSVRAGGERRCIEIKGRAATGEVEVTDNEWARACNLRQDYWLYAVYHCATPTPQLVRVQDPFEKLLIRPFTRTRVVESVREVGGVRIGHSQVLEAGEV